MEHETEPHSSHHSALTESDDSPVAAPRRQRGHIALMTLAVILFIVGAGLAFLRWSADESYEVHRQEAAIKAYYLAQMGIVEQGFTYLRTREPASLPIGRLSLFPHAVPGIGSYEDVYVQRLYGTSSGDIFTSSWHYELGATGVVTYTDGQGNRHEVRRQATLIVQLRSFSDYMYLTDSELTVFNDRVKFWHGDTLWGRTHSNDQIAIMQDPVFYDVVSTCASDFWRGIAYSPQFLGPPPVFNAPKVLVPDQANNLRTGASSQGLFFQPALTQQMRAVFGDSGVTLYTWDLGTPFTDSNRVNIPTLYNTCIFCDCPLEIMGVVLGSVTIGSSQDVRIIDDIRYRDANPLNGQIDSSSTNYLGIISEGNVLIANTPVNGRDNSGGMGQNQTNPAVTSIIITAAIVSLGESFTFEDQNDTWDAYQGPSPDERGKIYSWGSITQKRRGYVHRSNHGGTGYLKDYHYDTRFKRQRPPCFFEAVDESGRGLFNIISWGGQVN
jgi:hypothetical protein